MIGKEPAGPSGHDQTSLIVSVKNEPGAVFKLLEPLARHGVSMTRFESRPARVGTWEYYFYIDVEGHRDDDAVKAALAELGKKAAFLKILGSYPRARWRVSRCAAHAGAAASPVAARGGRARGWSGLPQVDDARPVAQADARRLGQAAVRY